MSSGMNISLESTRLLDDDEFLDLVDNSSYSNETNLYHYFLDSLFFISHIIKFLIFILALASDIYLIVVIRKFKNLQNRVNNFILQYVIFNLLYLVLSNFLLILMVILIQYHRQVYCIISDLDHLLMTLCLYVLTFMAVDWYIYHYHSNVYDRFPKTFKYGAYILYLVAIPKWITTSTVCIVNTWEYENIRLYFEVASYFMCLITLIYITIVKQKKAVQSEAYKTQYAFILPRIVLLLHLAPNILKIVELLPVRINGLDLIRYFVDNLLLVGPIVILRHLSKTNKYFKSAYLKSCKKRLVKSYNDDNLDTSSVNEAPQSNINFDRNSVNIIV